MRPSIFAALFVALLVIVSLVLPVPFGPQPVAGDPLAVIGKLPACLRLTVDSAFGEDFPDAIRLREARGLGPDQLAADGCPESPRLYNDASWRAAGRDSVDIGWHHSPVIRIPLKGDSLVGRAASAGSAPIWQLVGLREYKVTAHIFPCSEFIAPAP